MVTWLKRTSQKLFAYLTADVQHFELPAQGNENTFYIEDGNARLYTLKDLPDTFEQVCMKILQVLPKNKDVIFSTDMYVEGSVKSQERMRRGISERLILEGVQTRRPADFKSFLLNENNKAHRERSLQVTACVVFLLPHMKRVNYRVAQWKRVTSRNHSLRTRPAWMGIDNQRPLEPVWSEELYFLLYGGNPVRE
ncbi:hypothetical protein GQR58_005063 [Nymphon striatum]|nr:hypothetical protein GQR58_005063 [Nymphon striatum]